jgi:hypothetical protein
MTIATDIEERITEVVGFMTGLNMTAEIWQIADSVVVMQKTRIASGIDSSGKPMDTRAANRIGRYSTQQARKKTNPNIRNLYDSGEMLDDFGIQATGYNFADIGFGSSLLSDRADYNEAYMRQQAFDASRDEILHITETFDTLFEQKFL